LAWPLRSYKRISASGRRSGSGATAQPVPFRLSYAEDALKTLSLPEGSSYPNYCRSPLCWIIRLCAEPVLTCAFFAPEILCMFQHMRRLSWTCPVLWRRCSTLRKVIEACV
jgi:hypothetical protein